MSLQIGCNYKQEAFRERRHFHICDIWHWRVTLTLSQGQNYYVIRYRSLYCTLVPGMMSVSVIVCEINQTNRLTSCLLRSRAFCASRSRKFTKKKSVSQSTRNALKRIEMQKKNVTPLTITRFALIAKPERRSAMKFNYNQSDLSSNIPTKFD